MVFISASGLRGHSIESEWPYNKDGPTEGETEILFLKKPWVLSTAWIPGAWRSQSYVPSSIALHTKITMRAARNAFYITN